MLIPEIENFLQIGHSKSSNNFGFFLSQIFLSELDTLIPSLIFLQSLQDGLFVIECFFILLFEKKLVGRYLKHLSQILLEN